MKLHAAAGRAVAAVAAAVGSTSSLLSIVDITIIRSLLGVREFVRVQDSIRSARDKLLYNIVKFSPDTVDLSIRELRIL